jgi:hypothetical protein
MVEVFKTNVESPHAARQLTQALTERIPAARISFDLEDKDRILRIETQWQNLDVAQIIAFLREERFACEVLEDVG